MYSFLLTAWYTLTFACGLLGLVTLGNHRAISGNSLFKPIPPCIGYLLAPHELATYGELIPFLYRDMVSTTITPMLRRPASLTREDQLYIAKHAGRYREGFNNVYRIGFTYDYPTLMIHRSEHGNILSIGDQAFDQRSAIVSPLLRLFVVLIITGGMQEVFPFLRAITGLLYLFYSSTHFHLEKGPDEHSLYAQALEHSAWKCLPRTLSPVFPAEFSHACYAKLLSEGPSGVDSFMRSVVPPFTTTHWLYDQKLKRFILSRVLAAVEHKLLPSWILTHLKHMKPDRSQRIVNDTTYQKAAGEALYALDARALEMLSRPHYPSLLSEPDTYPLGWYMALYGALWNSMWFFKRGLKLTPSLTHTHILNLLMGAALGNIPLPSWGIVISRILDHTHLPTWLWLAEQTSTLPLKEIPEHQLSFLQHRVTQRTHAYYFSRRILHKLSFREPGAISVVASLISSYMV